MSTLTPDDVAADLHKPRESVMRLLRDGVVPGFRVGRAWRIDPTVYAEWKSRPASTDPHRIEPMSNRSRANLRRRSS